MAKLNLVHVMVSITSLKEELRLAMEPRTVTAKRRLQVIEQLSKNGIPCGIMTAPIVPGLNSEEIPSLLKEAAENGARTAGYTIVRLNGAIADIFTDWIKKNFPDRAEKVLNHIKSAHGGQLNDSHYGKRMRGEGNMIQSISQLFKNSVKKYFKEKDKFEFDLSRFSRPGDAKQLELF